MPTPQHRHVGTVVALLVAAVLLLQSSTIAQEQLLSDDKLLKGLSLERETTTTTYTLHYDGLLNANQLQPFHDNDDDDLIPYAFVETISTDIASDLVQRYHVHTSRSSGSGRDHHDNKNLDLDRRCYRVSGDSSVRCALDHHHHHYVQGHDSNEESNQVSFHFDLHIYRQTQVVLVRFDVSVTTTTTMTTNHGNNQLQKDRLAAVTRNVLVDSISSINGHLQMKEAPVWSIQHRPSFLEARESRLHHKHTSVTLLQRAEELQKASLQQIMLSPSSSSSGSMLERRRIDTVKVKTSTTDASNSQHQHDVQVWQYREVGSKAPIRSLFVNGYLRATATAIAAAPDSLSSMALTSTIAHAEAMIHPAMVAHMAPKRIALWSSTPQPLLREILKHQSVEHVTVLLDDDNNVIKYMNRWFPRFNDCSFRSTANTSTSSANNHNSSRRTTCMDQPGVDVVNHTTVDHWVEGLLDRAPTYTLDEYYKGKATASQGDDCNMTAPWVQPRCHYSRHPQFDIIFIEIPITNSPQQDWLNVNLHQKLLRLLAPESIVILNVGSAPLFLSNSHKYDDEDPSPRDVFLLHAARSVEHGGIGCAATLIYEEPLSSPLPTTNIACFAGDSWSYARFVQKHNPASFDLDLIAKVYPVATRKGTKLQKASKSSKPRSVFRNTPTLVYDGPTHVAYLQTPLAWEYWYCRNPILGKSTYACTSFLNQWYNASYHSLSAPSTHVQRLPVKGRALLATQVIPKGHFVLSQDTALSLQIDAVRWYALERFVESFPDAKLYSSLRDVFKAYGFENEPMGMTGWSVSIACNTTFINHGCTDAEINAEWVKDLYVNDDVGDYPRFSPFLTRRGEIAGVLAQATRDIQVGEEIVCDYRSFRSYDDDDAELEELLERICDHGVGLVSSDDSTEEGQESAQTTRGSEHEPDEL